MMKLIVVLNDIRSVHNVGSIFRTADAVGVEKIYCCGITPGPLDRFKQVRSDFAKVSLGAELSVAWELVKDALGVIAKLRSEGYTILAVEQSKEAMPYSDLQFDDDARIALVLGAEVDGLPEEILAAANQAIEIPMRGAFVKEVGHPRSTGQGKESLNVAVAFGVIAFSLRYNKAK